LGEGFQSIEPHLERLPGGVFQLGAMDCRDPISLLLCSCLVVFLLYAGPCSAANAGINGPPLSNLTLDMGFNNATHIVSLQVASIHSD
jgi:hypothetical protein